MLTRQLSASQFQFDQSSPSATWVIDHELNRYPNIDVWFEQGGDTLRLNPAGITYVGPNQVVITFSAPRQGIAVLS
jgi:hypothetical protein